MSIGMLRTANLFTRTVASVVLVTFSCTTLSPAVHAAQQTMDQVQSARQAELLESRHFGKNLTRAKELLRRIADDDGAAARSAFAIQSDPKAELRAWRSHLMTLKADALAEFAATGELLATRELPAEIKRRHTEAIARFRSEIEAFEHEVDVAISSEDATTARASAESAYKRLDAQRLGRSQQKFDPNNLPNALLRPDRSREPKTDPSQFQAALLVSESTARYAQAAGFDFTQLPGAADPAYLAGTTEVILNAAIQAKAQELHNDPIEIYNWVRNNVHWLPTWGALQDSSHTLAAKRGNAFDISSLTIALLRASGFPARYVYGTIDVPEDKFRNWAGGFQNIEAALDFASSGGIPVRAVTSGGRITKVRLEHVWIEAAIDFNPSRGTRNISADSWVSLDPSYKQIEVLGGLDPLAVSGLDAQQLSQSFLSSGTINPTESWATGFDQSVVLNARDQARAAIESHIQQNIPDATVGEVLGGRRIIASSVPVLAAGLPNAVVATGARFATVPASLQQQITFAFGADILGDPTDARTFPWPRLNSRQVTLSFRPATQADEDAIRALLPEGGVTDLSQIPSSIPAYLIRVVPELKVEGEVVMTGSAMQLGTDLRFIFNPKFVSSGVRPFEYSVPAGSYLAVSVLAGSINPAEIAELRADAQTTHDILSSGTPEQRANLARERILGDTFEAGLLNYYTQYTSQGYVAGLKTGGHHQLAAGLGSFGYELNVDYYFGVPRRVTHGGAVMNIPIVNVVTADTTEAFAQRDFALQLGLLSSNLEHVVPEQMFGSPTRPVDGISAVKALTKASLAGQRIYQITSANSAAVLPLIHHDAGTMSEIRAALAAGKTVITHPNAVSVPGWSGAGYVMVDAETGAGAWKIAGGANGGWIDISDDLAGILTFVGMATGLIGAIFAVNLLIFISALIAIVLAIDLYLDYLELDTNCTAFQWLIVASIIFSLIAVVASAGLGLLLGYVAFLIAGATMPAASSAICRDPGGGGGDEGG